MLDSGAQSSIIGNNFAHFISVNKFKRTESNFVIKTADGTAHNNVQVIEIPITYNSKTKYMRMLLVPSISTTLILGIDFWEIFGIKPVVCEMIECEKKINVHQNHELSEENAKSLQEILKSMPFAKEGILSVTHLIKHKIDTANAQPIKQVQYAMSPYIQKDVYAEIDRLLKIGAIYRCQMSAWNNPVIAVKKPNGKIRLCIDARKLNSITVKDAYPLQQINRILAQLTGTKFLSSIDFSDAYHQVELDEQSREKTAFAISGKGYFAYKRMPFGLCNSGATLCRLVDSVMGCDLEPNVFVYLDDIIIATDTIEKHFDFLARIATRLKDAGLTISPDKSRFCMKSLKYLGYIIDEEGIHPDPEKTAAVHNYPQPKNVKDVRRLLGLAGWYRRFIPNFSTITAPLSEMTKKGRKFVWSIEAENALQAIKNILVSEPVLANADYSKPFVIQTDASDLGMGGVLVQGEGAEERVVAYTSAKFSATQRNYQTTERECLAVINAIEKFRPYIDGVKFTVVTDHASLQWLRNIKDPTGRLCRWALRLQPYNFDIVHRKGSQMVVADAFSRAISSVDISSFSSFGDRWYKQLLEKVSNAPEKFSQFRIENSLLYKNCPQRNRKYGYVSEWRLVVPLKNRIAVIGDCHTPPLCAHGGYHKTIDRIRRQYYWPNMDKDVRNFVRTCEVCKAVKAPNITQRSPMGSFRESNEPWQVLYLDFIGPLPRSKSGNIHILTVVDAFSKFVHAQPLRLANSKNLISFLENRIFLVFGVPEIVICDNGSQFTSTDFKTFLDKYNIKFWPVSRYHPQANAAEAANKTIGTSIRAYVKDKIDHREWDKSLSEIVCAMNTSLHSSTKFSPYFVNFGKNMITNGTDYSRYKPNDNQENSESRFDKIRQIVKTNLQKTYEQGKKRYDLRTRPITYNVGDVVWKKNTKLSDQSKSLTAKFFPYVKCKIKKKIGNCSYELIDMEGRNLGIFNTDMIKS